MRVHHLNCGTSCPLGGHLFDGTSDGLLRGHIVCHCLLIESEAGLVLVDTGFGTRDIARPRRLARFFRVLNGIQLRPEETAVAQIRALGFDPSDVRHVVLTHLDFDHAGGLEDFPQARVHVLAREKEVADAGRGGPFVGARRYRAAQWNDVVDWALYPSGRGERWMGFDNVVEVDGVPDLLIVPLAGHTWGHAGIAIRTDGGWMLHAGDAYFFRGEVGLARPQCPPGMRFYQWMMEVDRSARLRNQSLLRRLSLDRKAGVIMFCAHDPVELEQMVKRSAAKVDA